ncbi:hypothetical protein ACHQM5_006553 [Ranunculus cassubicifolius]
MATQTFRVIRDENVDVRYGGACVSHGSNVNESQKNTDRSGRRALVDISNSKKLSVKNASAAEKKNGPAGRRALTDISNLKKLSSHQSKEHSKKLDNIAEECFLHNHQECIDSQRRGLDLQTFFTGLDEDFLVGLRTPPVLSKTKSKVDFPSPPRYMEYLDVPELLNEVELPPYEGIDTIPSPCSSRYASPTFDLLKSP